MNDTICNDTSIPTMALLELKQGFVTGKRSANDSDFAAGQGMAAARPTKQTRVASEKDGHEKRELKPAPFFFYRDFSTTSDPDPLEPLTPAGRVPHFPAKIHAILSRPDLKDVVAWMPHGRAWRVLKPREFEIKVIPKYFEHSKFSSFVRQANGWGFRRITQGPGRNAYYHELFLRGLPHLCKMMKRPGVNEKKTVNPELEPDLQKISEIYPVPEKADDDSILLECTVQGGPKARMPIYTGGCLLSSPAVPPTWVPTLAPAAMADDQKPMASFHQNSFAPLAEHQGWNQASVATTSAVVDTNTPATSTAIVSAPPTPTPATTGAKALVEPAATVDPPPHQQAPTTQMAFPMPPTFPGFVPSAAAQFAAGFALATASIQQQLMSNMNTMLTNMGQQQQQTGVASYQQQQL